MRNQLCLGRHKKGTVITHGTLGYGGFGRVFPAVHARTGEPLAV